MSAIPHQTREFVTIGDVERMALAKREAEARAEASRDKALSRMADAVRDLRALDLAGVWKVEAAADGMSARLVLPIPDPARADRLRDLIHGAD
jgi:hypothetical protein